MNLESMKQAAEAATPKKKRLTPKQRRMARVIDYFQDYVADYTQQSGCLNYSDEVFIEDMLYGIGVAIGGADHEFATGFSKFKDVLRQHLSLEALHD